MNQHRQHRPNSIPPRALLRPPAEPPGNTRAGLSSESVRRYVSDALRNSLHHDITILLQNIGYPIPVPVGRAAEEVRRCVLRYLESEHGRKFYEKLLERTAREWLSSREGTAELAKRQAALVEESLSKDKVALEMARMKALASDVEQWLQSPQGQQMLDQARRTAIRKQASLSTSTGRVSWIERQSESNGRPKET